MEAASRYSYCSRILKPRASSGNARIVHRKSNEKIRSVVTKTINKLLSYPYIKGNIIYT